eukprot:TRINITY_DN8875_c0_g1_i1.p1 TRINITY_DN8875_c0_g1~~TRINITY_DN8875_c0_g1_i1.p1  ORF type:complete len:417 (+),score=102.69 TRINITY_DN8875_c0_g1_i1:52-1251(+)
MHKKVPWDSHTHTGIQPYDPDKDKHMVYFNKSPSNRKFLQRQQEAEAPHIHVPPAKHRVETLEEPVVTTSPNAESQRKNHSLHSSLVFDTSQTSILEVPQGSDDEGEEQLRQLQELEQSKREKLRKQREEREAVRQASLARFTKGPSDASLTIEEPVLIPKWSFRYREQQRAKEQTRDKEPLHSDRDRDRERAIMDSSTGSNGNGNGNGRRQPDTIIQSSPPSPQTTASTFNPPSSTTTTTTVPSSAPSSEPRVAHPPPPAVAPPPKPAQPPPKAKAKAKPKPPAIFACCRDLETSAQVFQVIKSSAAFDELAARIFQATNVSGNGRVSLEELHEFCEQSAAELRNDAPTEEEVADLFRDLDVDETGGGLSLPDLKPEIRSFLAFLASEKQREEKRLKQ